MMSKKEKIKRVKFIKKIFRVIFLILIFSLFSYSLWATEATLRQYIYSAIFLIPFNSFFNYLYPMVFVKSKYDLGLSKYLPELFLTVGVIFPVIYITVYEIKMAEALLVTFFIMVIMYILVDKALWFIEDLIGDN